MPNWMDVLLSWWVSLFQGDWAISGTLVGVVLGVLTAVFAGLLVGCAVVWTVAGMKFIGRSFADGLRRGWAPKQPVD